MKRQRSVENAKIASKKCKTAILLYCYHTSGVLPGNRTKSSWEKVSGKKGNKVLRI